MSGLLIALAAAFVAVVGAAPVPAPGYADIHSHMFAAEAFGGGWMHGAHNESDLTLADCDGGVDHARLRTNLSHLLRLCPATLDIDLSSVPLLAALFGSAGGVASRFVGKIEGTRGDTGRHDDRKSPVEGWPRWDTIAHQQVWEPWLRRAHDGGLTLAQLSLVSNEFLCKALPEENVHRPACDEMDDVAEQLAQAHDFAKRNAEWAEIALDPAHARDIIASGKLAIVLAIETTKLFDKGSWEPQFDWYYSRGVRSMQPVHQQDNRFAGAAPHNPIFQVAQFVENCHIDFDCGVTTKTMTLGFDVDEQCRNVRGLTDDGRKLVLEMMRRGMLVDMAHMSERSMRDTFDLASANDYYPLFISHGHLREVMNPELARTEKTTPAWAVRMIRQTGGMFGLRTAHDETRTYSRSGVANSCHGSSRSLAQALEFARQGLKVGTAIGADFNGFIQQVRPRFGDLGACSAGFRAEADAQAYAQETESAPGRLGSELDEHGLAHGGLLPDLIEDLRRVGAHVDEAIDGSTERFLRMWERAAGPRDGMADPADDIDVSGVEEYVGKDVRKAAYPTKCSVHYAPGSRFGGQACRFGEECASGKCDGARLCGIVEGKCGCSVDKDCRPAELCVAGSCVSKRS